MKFIFISNDPIKIAAAEKASIDYVMIDLEILGKEERQKHRDTLISKHTLDDIKVASNILSNSKIIARINPLYSGTDYEIDEAIKYGAKAIMLPMFEYPEEVEVFLNSVAGRAETILLFETPKALINRDLILELKGLNRVHLGLNDLHLAMNLDFMFDLFPSGIVEMFSNSCINSNIDFGIGGIAPIGSGLINSKYILTEHIRLQSSCTILSRDFHKPADNYCDFLNKSMTEIREEIFKSNKLDIDTFMKNKLILGKLIRKVSKSKR